MTQQPTQLVPEAVPGAAPVRLLPGWVSARFGTALAGLALLLIGSLHVLPPSNRISWSTRTISEYALGTNGWLFDLGVLTLAAGSAVVLFSLVRARVVAALSPASLFVGLWAVALVVLVFFEKTNWAVGPSVGGTIHRFASLVAFLSLPIGALLAAGRVDTLGGRDPAHWRGPAALTRWAGLAALVCFSPLLYAIGQSFVTDISWWRVFPLGTMERVLGLSEVLVVLALGWWGMRAAAPATGPASAPNRG